MSNIKVMVTQVISQTIQMGAQYGRISPQMRQFVEAKAFESVDQWTTDIINKYGSTVQYETIASYVAAGIDQIVQTLTSTMMQQPMMQQPMMQPQMMGRPMMPMQMPMQQPMMPPVYTQGGMFGTQPMQIGVPSPVYGDVVTPEPPQIQQSEVQETRHSVVSNYIAAKKTIDVQNLTFEKGTSITFPTPKGKKESVLKSISCKEFLVDPETNRKMILGSMLLKEDATLKTAYREIEKAFPQVDKAISIKSYFPKTLNMSKKDFKFIQDTIMYGALHEKDDGFKSLEIKLENSNNINKYAIYGYLLKEINDLLATEILDRWITGLRLDNVRELVMMMSKKDIGVDETPQVYSDEEFNVAVAGIGKTILSNIASAKIMKEAENGELEIKELQTIVYTTMMPSELLEQFVIDKATGLIIDVDGATEDLFIKYLFNVTTPFKPFIMVNNKDNCYELTTLTIRSLTFAIITQVM